MLNLTLSNEPQDFVGEPKLVWMVGSSFVHWAGLTAQQTAIGTHLGFDPRCTIHWFGRRGLTINLMDRLMDDLSQKTPKPDLLLIHCGSNDLTEEGLSGIHLCDKLKCSLLRYQALFSSTKFIWSAMLPRRYWHFAPIGSGLILEKKRRRVNALMKAFVVENNAKFISNDYIIKAKELSLFKIDGTHLSALGNEVLLNNWKAAFDTFFNGDTNIFPIAQPQVG